MDTNKYLEVVKDIEIVSNRELKVKGKHLDINGVKGLVQVGKGKVRRLDLTILPPDSLKTRLTLAAHIILGRGLTLSMSKSQCTKLSIWLEKGWHFWSTQ